MGISCSLGKTEPRLSVAGRGVGPPLFILKSFPLLIEPVWESSPLLHPKAEETSRGTGP